MESAKKTIDRLRAGDVPADFPGGVAAAQRLGEEAHTWRNYLAAGAIGPDIFFLLPDFKGQRGNVLLTAVEWIRDVWEFIDKNFMEKWNKWAQPAIDGAGQILDDLSGGLLHELGLAMQELVAAITDAVLELITKLWDWFGVLTSGVPKGYEDSAFFWSDMFHYRKTLAFPKKLFENARTPQHRAFALGWMSHCATDVTGHAFVNEKSGGPYRLHWQRHHLVENHMDAMVYDSQHGGVEPYGELDTSALHFRLAFRKGKIDPYLGTMDAPAYDYFTGFPSYPTEDSAPARKFRNEFFDLDSQDLPDDLCKLIIKTMADVYGDDPKILKDDPAEFRDGDSGRPNVRTIQNTYWLLYSYVKFTSTSGYSPRKPTPPPFINDHSPPSPPGSDGGAGDDPARGGDPSDDDFDLLDLFLALFAWLAYIGELGLWLATLPLAVAADILSYGPRVALYELAVVPMWNLYMAARKPLVMQGFLMPKHEEIERGLVELGLATDSPLTDLAAALASPDGTGTTGPLAFDEHSGSVPGAAYGTDPAYPRAIIEDQPSDIATVIGYFSDPFCGTGMQPSEFLRPWKYPDFHNDGALNGWEATRSHAGPYLQGQDARVLMGNAPGHPGARDDFEKAATPAETEKHCDTHLPVGENLGGPVDYGVHVMSRLLGAGLPDFNLDADRGYAYHCWDWDRSDHAVDPDFARDPAHRPWFVFQQPCTVPEGYCDGAGGPHYNPNVKLALHYLDAPAPTGCRDPDPVSHRDIGEVGFPPTGRREARHRSTPAQHPLDGSRLADLIRHLSDPEG